MELTIKNWGNSKAIIIPKKLTEKLNINIGDEFDVTVIHDKMYLDKVDK